MRAGIRISSLVPSGLVIESVSDSGGFCEVALTRGGGRRLSRDLIEAGLNEDAGEYARWCGYGDSLRSPVAIGRLWSWRGDVLVAHWRQPEAESILQAVAIDGPLHRIVSGALFDRADSAASAVIKTMGS
jgi:hypothetical protein